MGVIDDINGNIPGNWMIRASGTTALPGGCAPTVTPTGTQPTATRTNTPAATRTPVPTATPTYCPNCPTPTGSATPTATATFCAAQQLMFEGFESGTLDLFSSVSTATPTTTPAGWNAVTTTAHAGSYSAYAPDLGTVSDQRLTSVNPVVVPLTATQAVLTFWHRYDFESAGPNYNYDGGVLDLTTDGGETWTSASNYFISGGYNGVLQGGSPLGAVPAWTGSSNGRFVFAQVNLVPFAGQLLRFRFRLGTDASVSREGWYVDDVQVVVGGSCGTSTPTPTATFTSTPTATYTLTPTSTPPCLVLPVSTDVPKPIPDFTNGTPGVVTSTLAVSGINTISDLNVVGLSISHSWIGDLQVSLTSPGGTTVLLIDRVCNSGPSTGFSNITLDDSAAQAIGSTCPPAAGGTYRPSNPLSAFNGQNAGGTWTLIVSDLAALDTGTLNAWGLAITSLSSCVSPTSTATPTGTGTPTPSATPTQSSTPTNTPTRTPTNTATPTSTFTPTATPTGTPTFAFTPTATSTGTPNPTGTPTNTGTPTGTPTGTSTPSATVTPGTVLIGHVTYQGIAQPSARNTQAITLTLCVSGVAQNHVQNTDASGFFTVTLSLSPGNYNYATKSYKNLANAGTLALNAGTNNLEFGTLKAGDTDNNNLVNALDFNRLKAAFGGTSNPNTDFNNDGITNSIDFNLLKGNYGQSGQSLTCP